MANCMNVFERGVRKENSEFQIVVRLFIHCSIDYLVPFGSILRMNTLQSLLPSRSSIFRVEAIYAIPFVGQVQRVSSRYLPDPTPRMREPLCFRQITLTPPQRFFGGIALTTRRLQRLGGAQKFLNRSSQVIARAPERFRSTPLRDAQ